MVFDIQFYIDESDRSMEEKSQFSHSQTRRS